MMDYDLLIAGGGPAGLTAGIYAARGGLKTGLITGIYRGGKTSLINKIDNYSGMVEVNGFILTSAMREQADRFGVEFIDDTIVEYRLAETPKRLALESGKELTSEYVVLAMGTNNKKLGIPNEEKLTGHGVSYCATCDGIFFKNKVVAVCGGGNSAFTDALYLSNLAKEVYLIHRRKTFKAADVMVQRVQRTSKIKMITESDVTALQGDPLEAITVKNVANGKTSKLAVDGVFVAVGSLPNTESVRGQVKTDNNGYIVTDVHMETSLANVFAAGDIRVTPLRQIITACADGAIAGDAAVKKRLGKL